MIEEAQVISSPLATGASEIAKSWWHETTVPTFRNIPQGEPQLS